MTNTQSSVACRSGSSEPSWASRQRAISFAALAFVQVRPRAAARVKLPALQQRADLAQRPAQLTVTAPGDPHRSAIARNHLRIQALAGAVDPGRIDEVLDLVQLTGAAGRRIGGFSLGMRQRLGLATALLADPEILILDEPANGLDPEGVHWLRRLLRGFAAEGGTVLVSSHMLAETAQTADSVVIIYHGRLIAQEPLASFTAHGDLEDVFLQLTGHASGKEA